MDAGRMRPSWWSTTVRLHFRKALSYPPLHQAQIERKRGKSHRRLPYSRRPVRKPTLGIHRRPTHMNRRRWWLQGRNCLPRRTHIPIPHRIHPHRRPRNHRCNCHHNLSRGLHIRTIQERSHPQMDHSYKPTRRNNPLPGKCHLRR